ncbi:Bug family tripartite tricarboxylate transporter substrate binding protein [uncultured Enterovirga sp.]|uniref:Bug family tripartite tricarboxylate transporter substrate binding protein n=1 Tax=uncultured Enterovirga sp. TaxID=2026352 RepID=UPI0035CB9127
MIARRTLLAAAASSLAARPGWASWSPRRIVTIVVPYPAGGATDVFARIVAREIAPELGQNVVVENAPGASGAVGTRRVARAEPDGHTLVLSTNQTHATNISLLRDGGGYDPVRDFTMLGGLADLQHLLVVRKDLPVRTVAEFLALGKAATPKLTCASTGIGSASHLTMELFRAKTGIDLVHVPYRGAAPLLQDLVGGRVDLAFATVPTVLGQVQAGELRALAVASPSPSPQVPDAPILSREGVAGVDADAWIAIFGPAGLPGEIRDRYAGLIRAALARPEVAAAAAAQGMLLNWREPESFGRFQQADIQRWADIIRAANVSTE